MYKLRKEGLCVCAVVLSSHHVQGKPSGREEGFKNGNEYVLSGKPLLVTWGLTMGS